MSIPTMGKIGIAAGALVVGGIVGVKLFGNHDDKPATEEAQPGSDYVATPPTAGSNTGSTASDGVIPGVDAGSTGSAETSAPAPQIGPNANLVPSTGTRYAAQPHVSPGDEPLPGDYNGGVSPGDDYSTYPNNPTFPSTGDSYAYVASAVRSAAPWSWTSANIATVTTAAVSSGTRASDAANMVRQVYSSTPYSFSSGDEARLSAAGLTNHTSPYEVANIIDNVEYATPYSWSTRSDMRLSLAAIRGQVPSGAVSGIIDGAISQAGWYGGEGTAVAIAESRLSQGGYGNSYPNPDYPYVPTFPTFPTYPDPSYPNPDWPGNGGVSNGDDWPNTGGSWPGNGGVSNGDDGGYNGGYNGGVSGGDDGGYPDTGGYPGNGGVSGGDDGNYSIPGNGGYNGGVSGGDDYPNV